MAHCCQPWLHKRWYIQTVPFFFFFYINRTSVILPDTSSMPVFFHCSSCLHYLIPKEYKFPWHRDLSINSTALEDFQHIMGGKNTHRIGSVRHILFLIILPGYPCSSCETPENWVESHRYVSCSFIFVGIVRSFLSSDSLWVGTAELSLLQWKMYLVYSQLGWEPAGNQVF